MYKRGDIIDINLNPTKGSETGKIRPCIIVTNDIYNKRVPILQVVPLTNWSEKKSFILSNITVDINVKNGLSKKSIADCLQTRPIDIKERFVKKRGAIDSDTLMKIDQGLKIVFELT
ncbi:MAG TPA: type II toxin-antitoxin system PemK/MazF family toxin [Campylobacterales bacterium]|nr:type II toxin-antitoxin system PemK/MazF family toxin [Campylobacterales bacterium]